MTQYDSSRLISRLVIRKCWNFNYWNWKLCQVSINFGQSQCRTCAGQQSLSCRTCVAGGYLQIPIFEYRSIYRLVPRSVQCCQLPCYHGRDPLPTCMVLASNQVVRTRALVHAQTWFPMGEVPSALCWSSGMPPPAAGGGGRF